MYFLSKVIAQWNVPTVNIDGKVKILLTAQFVANL